MGRITEGDFEKEVCCRPVGGLVLLSLNVAEIAFRHTLPKMAEGESSCLAMAYHREAIFAMDDSKARAVGLKVGLEISGTIGFLVFAVARQATDQTEANVLLQEMVANGYRSPVNDLRRI